MYCAKIRRGRVPRERRTRRGARRRKTKAGEGAPPAKRRDAPSGTAAVGEPASEAAASEEDARDRERTQAPSIAGDEDARGRGSFRGDRSGRPAGIGRAAPRGSRRRSRAPRAPAARAEAAKARSAVDRRAWIDRGRRRRRRQGEDPRRQSRRRRRDARPWRASENARRAKRRPQRGGAAVKRARRGTTGGDPGAKNEPGGPSRPRRETLVDDTPGPCPRPTERRSTRSPPAAFERTGRDDASGAAENARRRVSDGDDARAPLPRGGVSPDAGSESRGSSSPFAGASPFGFSRRWRHSR